jgi:phosphoglycolate phosphatase
MSESVRQLIQSAKGLVFDFDGTLVDSNEIKRRGFDFAFADYPQFMDQIRAYCYAFNHTSRFEKFRHVTEQILHLRYTSEMEKLFAGRYAEFTTASVAQAPEIPGAEKFLRSLAARRPALLSSTPTDVLLTILERRGWRSFFSIVQGAPIEKSAWLQGFQAGLGCRPDEVVFFGDTEEDARSGHAAGCVFVRVGRGAPEEPAIPDFTDL